MRINDGVTVTRHAQLQDPPLKQLKVIRLINTCVLYTTFFPKCQNIFHLKDLKVCKETAET